jgi:hypothetical protein
MENLKISYLFDKLMLNDEFSKKLQTSISEIMKDGKIDTNDIPQIMFIITELINNTPSIKITADELSELVKKLISFIIKQANISTSDEEQEIINKLVESSIKLILLQPKIKKVLNKCCFTF